MNWRRPVSSMGSPPGPAAPAYSRLRKLGKRLWGASPWWTQAVWFLGAGVIVRSEKGHRVHGLTTAACVWVTACVGAACAIAQWQIVVIGVVLVLILLVFGGPFERAIDDAGRGDRAGLRISRSTERVHLARRCKEIFLLSVRPSAKCFRRADASAPPAESSLAPEKFFSWHAATNLTSDCRISPSRSARTPPTRNRPPRRLGRRR